MKRKNMPGCVCCGASHPPPPPISVCVRAWQCSAAGDLEPFDGCTVTLTAVGTSLGGLSCITSALDFGGCCIVVSALGTYTITVVTPYGQTQTRTVTVDGVHFIGTQNFYFIPTLCAAVSLEGCCPTDPTPGGDVTFDFGSYGTCTVPMTLDGAACCIHPSINIDSGTVIDVTCTYRGRSQTGSYTVTRTTCGSLIFAGFVTQIEVGVCGCGFPQAGVLIAIGGSCSGTGTTNDDGYVCVLLSSVGVCGDAFTLTASATRFATATLDCTIDGGTCRPGCTEIFDGIPCSFADTTDPYHIVPHRPCLVIEIFPDDSHICVTCCALPLNKNLFYSDACISCALTWDAARGFWWGCTTANASRCFNKLDLPTAPCCQHVDTDSAVDLPCVVIFTPLCGWTILLSCCNCGSGISAPTCWDDCEELFTAPGGLGSGFPIAGGRVVTTLTCPPAFNFRVTYTNTIVVGGHTWPLCTVEAYCVCGYPCYRLGFDGTFTE